MIICTVCGQSNRYEGEFGASSFSWSYSPNSGFWVHIGCKEDPARRAPCVGVSAPPYVQRDRVRSVFTRRIGMVRRKIKIVGEDAPLYSISWFDVGSSGVVSEFWILREHDPDPLFIRDGDRVYTPDTNGDVWGFDVPDELRGEIAVGKHYADRFGIVRRILDAPEAMRDRDHEGDEPSLRCEFCDEPIRDEPFVSIKRKQRNGITLRAVACSPACSHKLIDAWATMFTEGEGEKK